MRPRLPLARALLWAPRLLAALFAAFLSVFAFAAFGEGHGVLATLPHFFAQLLPTLVVLGALAVGWRWEPLGAALFLGLALYYVATSWGRFPLDTYVAISGPMVLVALLLLASWRYGGPARAQRRRRGKGGGAGRRLLT